MKPFDLKQALSGKPVVTRDGRKVEEIKYFKTANLDLNKVAAVINGVIHFCNENGSHHPPHEHMADLFMAPEKREWWVGLSRVGSTTYSYLATSEKAVIDDASASKAQLLAIHKLYEEEL